MKRQPFGYRGRQVTTGGRDPVTSTYVGLPAGIVRSGAELWARLNGRVVNYNRAPVDDDEREQLRRLLILARAMRS